MYNVHCDWTRERLQMYVTLNLIGHVDNLKALLSHQMQMHKEVGQVYCSVELDREPRLVSFSYINGKCVLFNIEIYNISIM